MALIYQKNSEAVMLRGSGLVKSLGGQRVISQVDVEVRPGKTTVVIGPNGAGKSVLLRCLAMTDPADSGEIEVDGHRYTCPPPRKHVPRIWPRVTAVFQQLFLYPHLSIYDQILLPWRGASGTDARERMMFWADKLAIQHLVERLPNQLSLGERQRAALVRSLVLEPKYLLLDEITSALDVEQINKVMEVIAQLKTMQVGVFVISHLLGFVSGIADEVLFLESGRVAEAGAPRILSQPKTERLSRFVHIIGPQS